MFTHIWEHPSCKHQDPALNSWWNRGQTPDTLRPLGFSFLDLEATVCPGRGLQIQRLRSPGRVCVGSWSEYSATEEQNKRVDRLWDSELMALREELLGTLQLPQAICIPHTSMCPYIKPLLPKPARAVFWQPNPPWLMLLVCDVAI